MPEAANHGTDMITKIVPIRPPLWREIRHSHSITLAASFGGYTDAPPLNVRFRTAKAAHTEASARCAAPLSSVTTGTPKLTYHATPSPLGVVATVRSP